MSEPREIRRSWGGFAARLAGGLTALGGLALAGLQAAKFLSPTSGRSALGVSRGAPSAASLREGFEVKDLSARGLGFILAGMAGSAGTLIAIVFGMIWLFSTWDRADDGSLTTQQIAAIRPVGPLLQTQPFHDRSTETTREQQAMSFYGWNDARHTTAHVPIGRALVIVDGRSLDDVP